MQLNTWDAFGKALDMLLPMFALVLVLALACALLYWGVRYTPPGGQPVEVAFVRRAWLFAMAGIFGAVLGGFMGASQSLPMSNVLTVVVPLVSGYIAYLTSRDLAEEIKLFVPGAIASMLLAMVTSFWHMRFFFAGVPGG